MTKNGAYRCCLIDLSHLVEVNPCQMSGGAPAPPQTRGASWTSIFIVVLRWRMRMMGCCVVLYRVLVAKLNRHLQGTAGRQPAAQVTVWMGCPLSYLASERGRYPHAINGSRLKSATAIVFHMVTCRQRWSDRRRQVMGANAINCQSGSQSVQIPP